MERRKPLNKGVDMIEEVLIRPFPTGLELVRDKKDKEEQDYPRCFSPWEISLINAFNIMDEGYKRKGKRHVIGSLRLHIISSKGTGVVSLGGEYDDPEMDIRFSDGEEESFTDDPLVSVRSARFLTEIKARVVYVSAVIDSEPMPEEGMLFKSIHWLENFIAGK